ncbi:MAG: PQQ-binding-like beta-propeller repeat protein [Candidatus Eisenbacteria bacterium]
MFHRNAKHEARSTQPIANSPSILWSAPLTGAAEFSSPAIDIDGNIYVGDLGEHLNKFSPDGTLLWSFDTGGNLRRSSPAIADDGTVYVGSADGHLYALHADGSLDWTFQAGAAVKTSATIDGEGSIYFGADDGKVYSVSPAGALEWSYATGDTVRSTPAVLDDALIAFGSNDGGIYALDTSGALVWNGFTGGPVKAGFSFGQGGDLIAPSQDGFLYALSPSGSLQWSVLTNNSLRSTPAIGITGKIYVPVDDELHCYHDDGNLSYSVALGGKIFASPAVYTDLSDSTETVVIGCEDGNVYGIRLGQILWTVSVGAPVYSSAAIADDGTIYFGANDGNLYAIGGETADAPDSPVVLEGGAPQVLSRNPVRFGNSVSFRLPSGADGFVSIFDTSGRLVRSLAAREGEVSWAPGADDALAGGVYFFRWDDGRQSGDGRVVVVR